VGGLIKNRRVGRVGKGNKYCTIEEAIKHKLNISELVLEKVWNELDPFIINNNNNNINNINSNLSKWL
jgi:hypothetical protein